MIYVAAIFLISRDTIIISQFLPPSDLLHFFNSCAQKEAENAPAHSENCTEYVG